MALQTNISINLFGVQTIFEDAYFKVIRIIEFSKKEGCKFDVAVYRNKDMADAEEQPIEQFGFEFPYNENYEDSILNECYTFMRSLDAFEDAIDC